MAIYIDFKEQNPAVISMGTDPNALTNSGGFPFVKDQAARDRAYSLMQQAEERAEEVGFDDEDVVALMNDALENEIQAIEFTGDDEEDLTQIQDSMYLFGHRMVGEVQNDFEKHSEQRLLDMLAEMVVEAEQAVADADSSIDRGATNHSGTYKADIAEKQQELAKNMSEHANKLRFMVQAIDSLEDLQNRLENN